MGAHRRLCMLPGLCIRRILFGHEPSNAARSLFRWSVQNCCLRSRSWLPPSLASACARRGRASPVAQRHACRVRGVHERRSCHFGRAGTTAAEVAAEGLLIGAPYGASRLWPGAKRSVQTRRASPPPKFSPLRALPRHVASRCGLRQRKSVWRFGALPFAGVAFMEIARHEQSGATSETMHPTSIKPARARTLSTRMLAGALIFGLAAGFVETLSKRPRLAFHAHTPLCHVHRGLCSAAAF